MNHLLFATRAIQEIKRGYGSNLLSFPVRLPESRLSSDREEFINAMRGAVTGVNIVTTDGKAGRFGLTVSAFSSVSAEPPTVLVCINRKNPACSAIRLNARFCVNVLSTGQRSLADTFAGMPSDGEPYDFSRGSWKHMTGGSPILTDSIASFDCTLETALNSGSHTIFTGLVTTTISNDDEPLLYSNRAYGQVDHNLERHSRFSRRQS